MPRRARNKPFATVPALVFGVLAAVLPGCAFDDHRAELETLYAAGRYDRAAARLDEPEVRKLYGSKAELLWKMDRGALALALDDDDTTIALLNEAEDAIALARERSGADILGQWAINDRRARYIAEPYEDIYINVIKMLAQFEAGRIDGGASVEARRLITKVNLLRDQYVTYRQAADSEADERIPERQRLPGPPTDNTEGQFIESPLGTFLSAIAFMKSGSRDFQSVAGKRLLDAIRLQEGLIGPVRLEDFEGLGEREPDSVNVLIVALSGRGPIKVAERFGPLLIGTVPIYFELPVLRTFPSEVVSATVEIEGGEAVELPLVEDLSAVATENHNRILPLIRTRTVTRTLIKMGISIAATEAARRAASDSDQVIVQLGAALAGLLAISATERADIRCWMFLPGQAHVGLLDLEPGEHQARIVYKGVGGGTVYATEWQTITARDRGLESIVTHYWR
jgi:hypothetical protein